MHTSRRLREDDEEKGHRGGERRRRDSFESDTQCRRHSCPAEDVFSAPRRFSVLSTKNPFDHESKGGDADDESKGKDTDHKSNGKDAKKHPRRNSREFEVGFSIECISYVVVQERSFVRIWQMMARA